MWTLDSGDLVCFESLVVRLLKGNLSLLIMIFLLFLFFFSLTSQWWQLSLMKVSVLFSDIIYTPAEYLFFIYNISRSLISALTLSVLKNFHYAAFLSFMSISCSLHMHSRFFWITYIFAIGKFSRIFF